MEAGTALRAAGHTASPFFSEAALGSAVGASELLSTSYGPLPGEKLLLTATGKAIFTCSGPSILNAFVTDDALQGLVVGAAQDHAAHAGDGTKAFVIMLAAALADAGTRVRI